MSLSCAEGRQHSALCMVFQAARGPLKNGTDYAGVSDEMKENEKHQVPQEPARYKASITREQFMFFEMRATAKLLKEGLSDEEAIRRIIAENLFQYPTEKQIRAQALSCLKRLHGLQDETLIGAIATRPSETAKQVCLYALMKYNRLVWDFMVTVIGEKYRNRDLTFSRRDLNVYFIRLQEQIDAVAAWSDTTVERAKQVLLRVLIENEYLSGRDATTLNPVWLDSELENTIRENHDEAVLPAFNCVD